MSAIIWWSSFSKRKKKLHLQLIISHTYGTDKQRCYIDRRRAVILDFHNTIIHTNDIVPYNYHTFLNLKWPLLLQAVESLSYVLSLYVIMLNTHIIPLFMLILIHTAQCWRRPWLTTCSVMIPTTHKPTPDSFTEKQTFTKKTLQGKNFFCFIFMRLAAGVAGATAEVGSYFLINRLLLPPPAAAL